MTLFADERHAPAADLFANHDRPTLGEERAFAECEPCDNCDAGRPCAEPHAAPYYNEAT